MTVAELRELASGKDDEWLPHAGAIAEFIWGDAKYRPRIYSLMRKNNDAPIMKLTYGPITARRSALATWLLGKEKHKIK